MATKSKVDPLKDAEKGHYVNECPEKPSEAEMDFERTVGIAL